MSIAVTQVNELERIQLTEGESQEVSGGRVYPREVEEGVKLTSTQIKNQVWWAKTRDVAEVLKIDRICKTMAAEGKSDQEVIDYLRANNKIY